MNITSNATITEVGPGIYELTATGFSGEAFAHLYADYEKGAETKIDITMKAIVGSTRYPYPLKAMLDFRDSIKSVSAIDLPKTADDIVFIVTVQRTSPNFGGDATLAFGNIDIQIKFFD